MEFTLDIIPPTVTAQKGYRYTLDAITAATDREDFVPYLTWIGKEEDA